MKTDLNIRIAIITPTYQRNDFLQSFISQILRQDYDQWTLLVIHDGENQKAGEIVGGFASQDSRVHFAQTEKRGNDFGVTPRLFGAKIVTDLNLADYIVFWDDDNAFYSFALSSIVRSLQTARLPDVLLVPIHFHTFTLPRQIPVEKIREGQIDMANIVVRAQLAVPAYEQVLDRVRLYEQLYVRAQDFLFLDSLRKEPKQLIIRFANCKPIGRYDGLRPLEILCRMLRLVTRSSSWLTQRMREFHWPQFKSIRWR